MNQFQNDILTIINNVLNGQDNKVSAQFSYEECFELIFFQLFFEIYSNVVIFFQCGNKGKAGNLPPFFVILLFRNKFFLHGIDKIRTVAIVKYFSEIVSGQKRAETEIVA